MVAHDHTCEVCGAHVPSLRHIGKTLLCDVCYARRVDPEAALAYSTFERAREVRMIRDQLAELPLGDELRAAIEACIDADDDSAIKTAWQLLLDAVQQPS